MTEERSQSLVDVSTNGRVEYHDGGTLDVSILLLQLLIRYLLRPLRAIKETMVEIPACVHARAFCRSSFPKRGGIFGSRFWNSDFNRIDRWLWRLAEAVILIMYKDSEWFTVESPLPYE